MNARSPKAPKVQKLRERFREATVGAIMTAAEEVFAEQGLHSAHMDDIARRAGVAVGTLYNHFADRDSLLAGLLEARRAEMMTRIDAAMEGAAGRPFDEQLRRFLRGVFEHFEAHRRFMQILAQGEYDSAGRAPAAAAKPKATLIEMALRLEKLARIGVRQKVLRSDGADDYPAMLLGLVRGVAMRRLQSGTASLLGMEDRIVEFFLHGASASP